MTIGFIISAAYAVTDIQKMMALTLFLNNMSHLTTTVNTAQLTTTEWKLKLALRHLHNITVSVFTRQSGQCSLTDSMVWGSLYILCIGAYIFYTNIWILQYRCFHHTLFTVTAFFGIVSWSSNKYFQTYISNFEWVQAYPMKAKGEEYNSLSLLFQHKEVPSLRKELKKSAWWKLLLTNTLSRYWVNLLDYKAYVHSHMAHHIFKIEEESPKTFMSDMTASIHQFWELGWYDWIKFWYTTISFSKDSLVLVKYLGPSIDICSTGTTMILIRRFCIVACTELSPPMNWKTQFNKTAWWHIFEWMQTIVTHTSPGGHFA